MKRSGEMKRELAENDAAPLYAGVKQMILDRIHSGEWPPKYRVPSENELVTELGVSKMTANRALRELANEGELVRIQGVGSFVAERKGASALFEVRNIAEEIAERGHSAEEAIGHTVMILVPDDRSEEEPAILARIRAGQKVEPYETRRRCKNGELVDVLLSVSPIYDAYGRIIGASKIAHDISAKKEAERLQTMLVGELNHRVKNVLATVMAIARQTLGRDDVDKASVETFEARLSSMARAHDLLIHGKWEQAELTAVIAQALSPYPKDKFEISGPAIKLAPRAVVSISLALHELATNAAKYGALSGSDGHVAINWSLETGRTDHLKLRWQESGGPIVKPPTRRGFGSRLIESLLAAELNGKVHIGYEPSGLICEVDAAAGIGWDQAGDTAH